MASWKRTLSRSLHPFVTKLFSFVAVFCLHLVYRLCRLSITHEDIMLTHGKQGRVIFAFWHGRLFFLSCYYNFVVKTPQVSILISMSRDGDYATAVVNHFKQDAVRGSTSRGARSAIRELRARIKQGNNLILTPDGPRGPAFQVHHGGIIKLSQMTGAPIIPVSYDANHKVTLKSWDRFIVPLPFSRVHMAFGEPLTVPRSSNPEQIEQLRSDLEKAIHALDVICRKAVSKRKSTD